MVGLGDVNVGNFGFAVGFEQADGGGDAAGNEAWAPIPAEHVLGFADEGAVVEVGAGVVEAVLVEVGLHSVVADVDGGLEVDLEGVFAFFEEPGDFDGEREEGVVVTGDFVAVEIDVTDGVEFGKVEMPDGGSLGGLPVEGCAVCPVGRVDPLASGFVHAIEGVFDDAVGDEVEVDVAGDLGGEPIDFSGLLHGVEFGFGGFHKLPSGSKVGDDAHHGVCYSSRGSRSESKDVNNRAGWGGSCCWVREGRGLRGDVE